MRHVRREIVKDAVPGHEAGLETQSCSIPSRPISHAARIWRTRRSLRRSIRCRLFGQSRSPEAPPERTTTRTEKGREKPPPEWGQISDGDRGARQEQGPASCSRTWARRCSEPMGCRPSSRPQSRVALARVLTGPSVYPLDRRGRDRAAERAELLCRPDGGRGRGSGASPLVESRQHGTFSLRDIDLATGQLQPGKDDVRPDEAPINAAFAEMPARGADRAAAGVSADGDRRR